jgi:hypothetical protein
MSKKSCFSILNLSIETRNKYNRTSIDLQNDNEIIGYKIEVEMLPGYDSIDELCLWLKNNLPHKGHYA